MIGVGVSSSSRARHCLIEKVEHACILRARGGRRMLLRRVKSQETLALADG